MKRRIIISEDKHKNMVIKTLGKFSSAEMADILIAAVRELCEVCAKETDSNVQIFKKLAAQSIMKD